MSRTDGTPTLVLNDRKIRGIANIKEALQEIKKSHRFNLNKKMEI